MSSLNKVMLIGRLGKDPEMRYTQSGQSIANFTLATSDYWKDSNGVSQQKTEWHNLVAWGRTAELVQNYLHKGSLVYIEGSLQTSSWDDQSTGQKRFKTEINARTIQFLERKSDSGQQPYQPQGGGYQAQSSQNYQQPSYQQQPTESQTNYSQAPDTNHYSQNSGQQQKTAFIDDDVPF